MSAPECLNPPQPVATATPPPPPPPCARPPAESRRRSRLRNLFVCLFACLFVFVLSAQRRVCGAWRADSDLQRRAELRRARSAPCADRRAGPSNATIRQCRLRRLSVPLMAIISTANCDYQYPQLQSSVPLIAIISTLSCADSAPLCGSGPSVFGAGHSEYYPVPLREYPEYPSWSSRMLTGSASPSQSRAVRKCASSLRMRQLLRLLFQDRLFSDESARFSNQHSGGSSGISPPPQCTHTRSRTHADKQNAHTSRSCICAHNAEIYDFPMEMAQCIHICTED
jgi:hypothetical protein